MSTLSISNETFNDTPILYDKVQALAIEQLTKDDRLNDDALNPNGEFYLKPEKYAMTLYAFFICCKCKEPYYSDYAKIVLSK